MFASVFDIRLRFGGLVLCTALAACGGRGGELECAPYARRITGLALYGPAAGWWDQAQGRYERSNVPRHGSVLVFRPTSRLPYGHVSVVDRVVSAREITVDHANWVPHRIAHDDRAIDVSALNDWSQVRVWWSPAGQMGRSVYPTFGFVDHLSETAEFVP